MITSAEMRELESRSGISPKLLMENAGKAAFSIINEKYGLKGKKILILCYHGNNSGDGFVVARHCSGISEVDILFLGDEEKFSPETRSNYEEIDKINSIQIFADYSIDYDDYDLIIDAMLGTGMRGEPRQPIKEVISLVNSSKAKKVSLDIPSGMDADSKDNKEYIRADTIITFHDLKPALLSVKDRVIIADIGLNDNNKEAHKAD